MSIQAARSVTFPRRRGTPAARAAWWFILPALAYLVLVQVVPILYALYLSFTRYDPAARGGPKLVGLDNYARMLSSGEFWSALRVTVQFAAEVIPLNIVVALTLALMLNAASVRLRGLRAAFFLPSVASAVAVSVVWLWMYEPTFGLFNQALKLINVSPVPWLSDPAYALHSMVLMRVWRGAGWNAVVYLAGLQTVPKEVLEAARVDGASGWQTLRRITWPLLAPVTLYVIVTGLISTLQTFSEVYVMTRGGPLNSTTTVGLLIYRQGFEYGEFGLAAATSFLLFFIIFTLAVLNFRRQRGALS